MARRTPCPLQGIDLRVVEDQAGQGDAAMSHGSIVAPALLLTFRAGADRRPSRRVRTAASLAAWSARATLSRKASSWGSTSSWPANHKVGGYPPTPSSLKGPGLTKPSVSYSSKSKGNRTADTTVDPPRHPHPGSAGTRPGP